LYTICSIRTNIIKGRCRFCILWEWCSNKKGIGDAYIWISADESTDYLDRL